MINLLGNPLNSLMIHRNQIRMLVRHGIEARYKDSLLGNVWLFINPVLMLTIYTLVFQYIFHAKWPNAPETRFSFSQLVFVGMIIHALAAEILTQSPTVIVKNISYVKKIVFPLEILPWVCVWTAFTHTQVNFLILAIFIILSTFSWAYTWLFLPIILLPFCFMLAGLSMLLAALGVYFRDLDHLMNFTVTALLFLSPVFYAVDSAPAIARPYLFLNPLTLVIEQCRTILIYQNWPDFFALSIYWLISVLVLIFGYYCFIKLKPGFADVL